MKLKLPSAILGRCRLSSGDPSNLEPRCSTRTYGADGREISLSRKGSLESHSSGTLLVGTGSFKRKSLVLQHDKLHQQQLSDAYEVEEAVIGRGGFGTVRIARLRDAPTAVRAVKTVWKRNIKAENLVRQEISILRRLDHPRICRLYETFEDDKAIYLVLEFIDGCELFDEIIEAGHLDELQAAAIMQQIFGALQYCHARKVVHRDLKPENIMVQRHASTQSSPSSCGGDSAREVKLIDFGLAVMTGRMLRSRSGCSIVGTEDYLSPEARDGTCLPASDVWSAGMILHALLVGSLPSTGVQMGEDTLDFSVPEYSRISPAARDLLSQLLMADPYSRIDAEAAANHSWTRGCVSVNSPQQDFAPMMAAFTSFHRSAKLRRAVLTALAMQLTSRELSGLREQFLLIDTDGNGRISREELAASIAQSSSLGGAEEVRAWVESIFDSVDTDGSQDIDYTEWIAAAYNEGTLREEEALRAAFRIFDTDGDGGIDQRELERVLQCTPEEIAGLMPQFDVNGDGVIDFQEFRSIVEWGIPAAAGEDPTVLAEPPAVLQRSNARKKTVISL